MKTKILYKIINEEVSSFDFLGMNNINDENTHNDLLNSKEFQTNLVNDIINNKNDKTKFSDFSATYVNKNIDTYIDVEIIELEIEPTYLFEGKNYDLIFFISGSYEDEDDIKFKTFNIKIFSKAGDQIKMGWIEKNVDLYEEFIKTLVTPFLD